MIKYTKSAEETEAVGALLAEMLDKGKRQVQLVLPYSAGNIVDLLKREAQVLSMEYTDAGMELEAVVTPEIFGRVKDYIPGYTKPKEDWE